MPRVLKLVAATTGTALVAAAAFFLQPRSGAHRRATARRETANVAALVGTAIDVRPRRFRANRWDDTLADRVRIALSVGFGESAGRIEVRSDRGVVTLRGEVEEIADITTIDAAIRSVGGVVDIDNLLRLRDPAAIRPHVLTA